MSSNDSDVVELRRIALDLAISTVRSTRNFTNYQILVMARQYADFLEEGVTPEPPPLQAVAPPAKFDDGPKIAWSSEEDDPDA